MDENLIVSIVIPTKDYKVFLKEGIFRKQEIDLIDQSDKSYPKGVITNVTLMYKQIASDLMNIRDEVHIEHSYYFPFRTTIQKVPFEHVEKKFVELTFNMPRRNVLIVSQDHLFMCISTLSRHRILMCESEEFMEAVDAYLDNIRYYTYYLKVKQILYKFLWYHNLLNIKDPVCTNYQVFCNNEYVRYKKQLQDTIYKLERNRPELLCKFKIPELTKSDISEQTAFVDHLKKEWLCGVVYGT